MKMKRYVYVKVQNYQQHIHALLKKNYETKDCMGAK